MISLFVRGALVAVLISAGTAVAQEAAPVLDSSVTPGGTTEASFDQLCAKDRPYVRVPAENRLQALQAYHVEDKSTREIHVVRLVPPSWGGSTEVKNLLPMTPEDEALKTKLAMEGHRLICAGQFELHAAQLEISKDWKAMYERLCGGGKCPAIHATGTRKE